MTYGFALFPGQGAQHPGMGQAAAPPHGMFLPVHPMLQGWMWQNSALKVPKKSFPARSMHKLQFSPILWQLMPH